MARRKFILAPLSPSLLVLYIVSVFVVCSDGHSFRNSKGNGAPRELEGLDPGTLQNALVSPFRDPYQQDPYQQGYASKKGQAVCSCSKQQTLLRSQGPGDWNLLGFIEVGGDCKDVKCILGKVKNIQHPCKDLVQQLVNAPDANAPDATSLKEIFTTMNAVNTFVENVKKCDDNIGKLAGLEDEEKTTFGSYIGKIKESKLYKKAFETKAAIEMCSFKSTMQDGIGYFEGFLDELNGCLKALETLSTSAEEDTEEDTESPGFLNDKIKKMAESVGGIRDAINIVSDCMDIDSLETAKKCVITLEEKFMNVKTALCNFKFMERSCKKIEKMKVFRLKAVVRKKFGKQIQSRLLNGLGAVVKLTKAAFSMYEKFTKSQMKFYKDAKCMCDPGAVSYGTPACSGDTVMVQVEGEAGEVEFPKLETQQECGEKHIAAHLEELGPKLIKEFANAGFLLLCKSAATATGLGSVAGVVVCDAAVDEANKFVVAFLTPEHPNSDMAVFVKRIRSLVPDFFVDSTFTGFIREKKIMRRDFNQLVCVCAPESDPHSSKRMLEQHKIGVESKVDHTTFGCEGLSPRDQKILAVQYNKLMPNDPPFCEKTYEGLEGYDNSRKSQDNENYEVIQKKMQTILEKSDKDCWPCRQFKNKNKVIEDVQLNEELLKPKSADEKAMERPNKDDKANIEKPWDCEEIIADGDSSIVPKFSKESIVNPEAPESKQKTEYEECEEHNKRVADHMKDKNMTDSANMWDCEKSYDHYGINLEEGAKLSATKSYDRNNFMAWNSSQRQSYKLFRFFKGKIITESFMPKDIDHALLRPILKELGITNLRGEAATAGSKAKKARKDSMKAVFDFVWPVYCRYRNRHSTKEKDIRNSANEHRRERALNKKWDKEAKEAAIKEKNTEQDCDQPIIDGEGKMLGPKYPKDDAEDNAYFCRGERKKYENLITENKQRVKKNEPIETYIQENHFEQDDAGNYIVASARDEPKSSCPGFTSYETCKNNNLRIKENKKEIKERDKAIKDQTTESSCITFMDECILSGEECDRNGALCGRWQKPKEHYRCFLPSEHGDNNYINLKCLAYIKKTKKFKLAGDATGLAAGDCEKTTIVTTCGTDNECKEGDRKCKGECVCNTDGFNECQCHKDLDKFSEDVYGALGYLKELE